ncbi:hypothetical protein ABHF91_08870 [Pseudaeromonas sp. ZJS20]|uniref:hypothetical protein n=1 Tax=Pseudaeromonas aegiceratis TaxID=3153928 RepID=UPI00390CC87B
MPNQDLLYSILPRAPVQPGSGEFNKDVTKVTPEPKLRQVETHKDPQERAPQDDYHPEHQPPADEQSDAETPPEPTSEVKTDQDGHAHVDLYI